MFLEIFIIFSLRHNFHVNIPPLLLIEVPHHPLQQYSLEKTQDKKISNAKSVDKLLKYYQKLLLSQHHEFLKK